MKYISLADKEIEPIKSVNIGENVIVKNGNGNWYQGVVSSPDSWHNLLLSPGKKHGVAVDYGDISLIHQKEELFILIK